MIPVSSFSGSGSSAFTISRLAGRKSSSVKTFWFSGQIPVILHPFTAFSIAATFMKAVLKSPPISSGVIFSWGMICHPDSTCLIEAFLKRTIEGDIQGLHSV
jgi:hypothetical protein